MSKQTAVEFIEQQLKKYNVHIFRELNDCLKQALAMEQEQIEQSYSDGLGNGCHYERGDAAESVLDEKQYYNETYGKEAGHEA